MSYYNQKYFDWQHSIGEFGGKANLFKFRDFIRPTDSVIDFGCGGGFLLKNIETSGLKYGVEINPAARAMAAKNGIECYSSLDEIPDHSVDIIISNHALEHVPDPAGILLKMKSKVKNGGRVVIVVPHEIRSKVSADDINMHLYTWSPQNLRNLFVHCGIEVERSERLYHYWPKGYRFVQKVTGWSGFHFICGVTSIIRHLYQTRTIGVVKEG